MHGTFHMFQVYFQDHFGMMTHSHFWRKRSLQS